MRLLPLFRRPSPLRPEPPVSLPIQLRASSAYACLGCGWIVEGTATTRCTRCDATDIFNVGALLTGLKNRAAQRQKVIDQLRKADRNGTAHDIAFLTALERNATT